MRRTFGSVGGMCRNVLLIAMPFALMASCTPDSDGSEVPTGDASDGTPLAQEDRIPMEVLNPDGSTWTLVHPTRAAVEKLAQGWCAAERGFKTDTKLCGGEDIYQDMTSILGARTEQDAESFVRSNLNKDVCTEALCYERNDICAGFFLEELARSPLQRVLKSDAIPGKPVTFPIYAMGITALDFQQLPSQVLRGATQVRFQPLNAAGRATALRGALARFQASTVAADLIQSQPLNDDIPTSTCLNKFASRDSSKQLPPVTDSDATAPWTELFLTTFANGAHEYSQVLSQAVDATRAAAQSNVRGEAAMLDEVATEWNGSRNSAVAVANFLAYAQDEPVAASSSPAMRTLGLTKGCAPPPQASSSLGVNGLPVCPPVNNNGGVQKVLKQSKAMSLSVSKSVTPALPFLDTFVAAYNEDLARIGKISAPLSQDQVLAQVGASEADVHLAEQYLCAESKMFTQVHTPLPQVSPALPTGFQSVPRFSGVASTVTLPGAALAAHFLGAPAANAGATAASADSAHDIKNRDYSSHGALRAMDRIKLTAGALSVAPTTLNVSPKVAQLLKGTILSFEAQTGDHRLEFWTGFAQSSDASTIDTIKVEVHGAVDGESYALVQGVEGLKCALYGTIDGAACAKEDYILALTNAVGPLDPTMKDLKGGTIIQDVHALPRPGSPQSAIAVGDAIYVLRSIGGHLEAFGGFVPTPGSTSLPGAIAYSRHQFAPAGGSYEDILKDVLGANADDCSHVEASCAGLPFSMVPPLESEVTNPNGGSVPFERSWQQYLDQARAAADAADQLGRELLNSGLAIDQRRETAIDNLQDLCGANANADGCPGLDDFVPLVAFGDKPVCSWTVNGQSCLCPVKGTCPSALAGCSVPAPASGLSGKPADDEALCEQTILAYGGPQASLVDKFKPIPVLDVLKLGNTPEGPTIGACHDIAGLRSGDIPGVKGVDATVVSERREQVIRNFASTFSADVVRNVASALQYSEDFADNYSLSYQSTEIFNTNRRERPSLNSSVGAPCNIAPEDLVTGSAFWTTPVQCFVSGTQCPPAEGVGFDGCPNDMQKGDFTALSMDTEPAALRNRWAWGFGHLRRAVATLGVITGKLDGMMALSRIGRSTYFNGEQGQASDIAGWRPWGCNPGPSDSAESLWLRHCAPDGHDDLRSQTLCVPPGGVPGIGSDKDRYQSGRPVNFNGFLANCNGPGKDSVSCFWDDRRLIHTFPCLSAQSNSRCDESYTGGGLIVPFGVDPQMTYCALPPPEQLNNRSQGYSAFTTEGVDFHYLGQDLGDGFTGSVSPQVANFSNASAEWRNVQGSIWRLPAGHFCSATDTPSDPTEGAVWRALCTSPPKDDLAHLMTQGRFMVFGDLDGGTTYFTREQVGKWLLDDVRNINYENPASYLFDQRGDRRDNVILQSTGKTMTLPFQYPINQRGIYDALELACHATNRPRTSVIDCGHIPLNYTPKNMDDVSDLLRCVSGQTKWNVANTVTGPVPRAVINALAQNASLAPTGIGGKILTSIQAEIEALRLIGADFDHISDQYRLLADDLLILQSIDRQSSDIQEESDVQVAGVVINSIIAASRWSIDPVADVSEGAQMAETLAQAALAIEGIKDRTKIQKEDQQQKSLGVAETIIGRVAAARDAARDVNTQLDNFRKAAADLKTEQHAVAKGVAAANLSDFTSDTHDPQYVNVVDRRVYNTNLIRYEQAVDRAKRAAFIARRAIEVRFGVDLQSMTKTMSLVDSPSKWANDICQFEGIDYAKIREPNPNGVVQKFTFAEPPPVGEDFANAFAGDYVTKLQNFVQSYPIDYPLKDGDDTAVISLNDDIFRAHSSCIQPSRNLLFESANFEKRSSIGVSEATNGWFVRGCSQSPTALPVDGDWDGCVRADALGAGARTDSDSVQGVSLAGLPASAVPYRLGNEVCVASAAKTCAPGTDSLALGSVSQLIHAQYSGRYLATLYTHQAPDGAPEASALLQIIHESDGATVVSLPLVAGVSWQRAQVAFDGIQGELYRLDIIPAANPTPLSSSAGSAMWIAAAQVETVPAGFDTASPWQLTNDSRTTLDAACNVDTGLALRSRFSRRCSYVCKDGIKSQCAATDPDALPVDCYYEAKFALPLENIENGSLIPSGQIAIGNFNFRHNEVGINVIGTGVTNCENVGSTSCYGDGFIQYSLQHNGDVSIRNWDGGSLHAHMSTANIEHGKALAAERVITNPPASVDQGLIQPYMKEELKGRPLEGLYTLRIYDSPSLRWENVSDIQLIWNYHYWTRFQR